MNPDPTKVAQDLLKLVSSAVKKVGQAVKAKIPSGYTSGNPTTQFAEETATTGGTRTSKVVQPYGHFGMAPAAGDATAVLRDSDGNSVIIGKQVDLASTLYDADAWGGLKWVQPGATVLLTANNQESTTNASFTDVKKFRITRPGKYRLNFRMAGSGASGQDAQVVIEDQAGNNVVASTTVTNSSVNPTFTSKSADMNVTALPGQILKLQIRNTAGGTTFVDQTTVSFADATASQGNQDAVILD